MKNIVKKYRQRGFADLGLSLLVLAISGTVVATSNHIEDKNIAAQQEAVVIEAQLGTGYVPMEMPERRR